CLIMNSVRIISNPSAREYELLVKRPQFDKSDLDEIISQVYSEVLTRGDDALLEFTKKFDKTELASLSVSTLEIDAACDEVPEYLKVAIRKAKENIEKFHRAQLSSPIEVETMPGVWCRQKSVPIQSVGIYIPGGTAPLF